MLNIHYTVQRYVSTESNTDAVGDSAVESIKHRTELGQSPVPSHCITFDLKAEARSNTSPSKARILGTLVTGNEDNLTRFSRSDIPETTEEMKSLLSDDPRVKLVDGGWVTTTTNE